MMEQKPSLLFYNRVQKKTQKRAHQISARSKLMMLVAQRLCMSTSLVTERWCCQLVANHASALPGSYF
jgi:hypothetical protein